MIKKFGLMWLWVKITLLKFGLQTFYQMQTQKYYLTIIPKAREESNILFLPIGLKLF